MSANKHKVISTIALALAALILVGLGVASSNDLHLRWGQSARNVEHRQLLRGEKCESCHKSTHKAPLVSACEGCHVTSTWESRAFQHKTDYLNRDAHSVAPCDRCHPMGGKIEDATCYTCHKTYAHKYSVWCQMCHTTKSWTGSHDLPKKHVKLKAAHTKSTCPDCHTVHDVDFKLYCVECHPAKKHPAIARTAQHKKISCTKCHNQKHRVDNLNKAVIKAKDCSRCHIPPHQKFSSCGRCHPAQTFKKVAFAHKRWPLQGAHQSANCTKCHKIKRLGVARGTACVSCHAVRHARLRDCARCHTQSSFKPSTFRHDSIFKLRDAHRSVSCSRCHPKNQWAKSKGTKCVNCHGKKHSGQTKCERCHTTSAWQPTRRLTHTPRYPLTGQHRYVECIGCHKQLNFNYTPTDCVSCHSNVSHGMSNCETCHTTESWSAVTKHGG